MKTFIRTDKMASVIFNNYDLLPVINRFGIKPGFKDLTIQDICEKKQINTEFF